MEYFKIIQITDFVFCLFHCAPDSHFINADSMFFFCLTEVRYLLSPHSSQSLTDFLNSEGWSRDEQVCGRGHFAGW